MKKQIEEFYSSSEINLPVAEIINRGLRRHGLKSKPCLQAAIEEYFVNKTKIGIPRFKIAWWIWKRAKQIENDAARKIYTAKYESEREELQELRYMKAKYKNIQRANVHDLFMTHGLYWAVIVAILFFIYFFGD